ncbi:T-complex protein 1 subunit zeta [Thelohanellus kitauei]|uniref:T-complex protein 1 subunit zeta n=1 Tax=Thelohanellus kitauei TaxID=669202 RepID=A0A0C2N2Z5_THEKT|nr:T-complex protein 1 subunit zeta [Thelohanellus kitauei]
MSSISLINPKADLARAQVSLQINTSAARGLQDVLSSNLGPRGTMKMLVSGGGEIKITKDGCILLCEMQIQHPTASLISRLASAQDDIVGDGTTSAVLLVGELLKQAEILTGEGMHPSLISSGYSLARDKCLQILNGYGHKISENNREALLNVARTSLDTKLNKLLVPLLSDVVVDAVMAIKVPGSETDLHMIEIMEMLHRRDVDTRLVRGLVLDHGGRHPSMPKSVKNAYILTCNVSFEYEKTEVNSGFFYKTAQERLDMVAGERKFTDDRVKAVIELKKKMCEGTDKNFVVITQKGIDPCSLSMFAEAGILALRRAKRRNMERLVLACGGTAINSLEDLTAEVLGFAGSVYEYHIGDDKFTFVEDVPRSGSITVLINGPTRHSVAQIKDALRDGLRAVNNALVDGCCLPGAGAVEIALREELISYAKTLSGKEQLGVIAFANALLVIPRTLSKNAGLDPQDTIVKLTAEYSKCKIPVGVNLETGLPIDPIACGIFDNLAAKRQIIVGATSISSNLLLVDEIIRAGVSTTKEKQG